MLTEVEAREQGAALMRRLKGTGWKLRVHENLGWYFYAYNGCISVHCSSCKGRFLTLLTTDEEHVSSGESFWTHDELFDDPNEAVAEQLRVAREFIARCQKAVDVIERNIANQAHG